MDKNSGPESHFSGVVVAKLNGDMISILALIYSMKGRLGQLRIPGGSKRYGEVPLDTAIRELRDEIAEEGEPFVLPTDCLHEVHRKSVPGDVKQGGGIHHKVFYVVSGENLVCTLRKQEIYEPDGVLLGSPSWHEATALVQRMFGDGSPVQHIIAVLKVIKIISSDAQVAKRYGGFIAAHDRFIENNT